MITEHEIDLMLGFADPYLEEYNGTLECCVCKKDIKKDEEYLRVMDDFLRSKYFDDFEGNDNIFCSTECLCSALFVRTYTNQKETSE